MISELTKEQIELMHETREEYLAKVFKNGAKPFNRDVIVDLVQNWLYPLCYLKKPLVITVDSPFAAQIAANLINNKKTVRVDLEVDEQVQHVRDQVNEQVRGQVNEQVRGQVYQQVLDQVRGQVQEQVQEQVWRQVRGQVLEQVEEQVWSQVQEQVWRQVREQVDRQAKIEYFNPSSYIRLDDYYWLAYYDFYRKIGVSGLELIQPVLDLINAGASYSLFFDGLAIISKHPKNIYRDSGNRLHNKYGLAIEYEDGWGFHALHGIRLSPEDHDAIVNQKWSFEDIIKLENTEIRVLALEFMGAEQFIAGSKAELVNTGIIQLISNAEQANVPIQNELYKVPAGDIFDSPEYFLKYKDPSTDRVYIEFVPPEIGKQYDADLAMAWRHHCDTKEEYYAIEQQS